jgi:hypothetical protein
MATTRPKDLSIAEALHPTKAKPGTTGWVQHMQGMAGLRKKAVGGLLSNAERGSGSPLGGFSDWRWSGRGRPAAKRSK